MSQIRWGRNKWMVAGAMSLLIFLFACAPPATPAGSVEPAFTPSQPTPTSLTSTSTTLPTNTTEPSPEQTAGLDPEDQFAFDQEKRIGRGLNLGNALEAPVEGEWGVTLEEGDFVRIAEAGFDSVRVPIRWSAHTGEGPAYEIDTEFMERIDWVVDQALANDLVVILNIHHFNELIEEPEDNRTKLLAIWSQVAEHFQDRPDAVMFELLNEPNGSMANLYWNQYVAELVPLIRQSNPKRTIIVGPGDWNSPRALPNLLLPEDDRNLIVTFHFYDPFGFTHQGAEWVSPTPELNVIWAGDEDDQRTIHAAFKLANQWAVKNRRPLYLGEFGAYSKAEMDSRSRWTAFVVETAHEFEISWTYWEYCSGFGVYDKDKAQWNTPLLDALIQEEK